MQNQNPFVILNATFLLNHYVISHWYIDNVKIYNWQVIISGLLSPCND